MECFVNMVGGGGGYCVVSFGCFVNMVVVGGGGLLCGVFRLFC